MSFPLKINKLVYPIVFVLFILFSSLILNVEKIEQRWKSYPDYIDYKTQSEFSLFSSKFYFTKKSDGVMPRPFTVPLMFKLVGGVEERVVILQKIIHCLSALSFILAILPFFKRNILKILISFFLFFYFTWWNIVGWTDNLLSESFSMSFMFMWFASLAYFIRERSWLSFIIISIIGFLFSFTRDSWPYIILFTYTLMAVFYFGKEKTLRIKVSLLLLFGFVTFLFQQRSAEVGHRYSFPLFNVISERVVENADYLNWFTEQGMPQATQLEKDFKGFFLDSEMGGYQKIYPRYYDSTYLPLFEWIKKDGKSVYSQFVLTHPSYFFMLDQTSEEIERVFCHSLKRYTTPALGFYANTSNLFPLFNIWMIVALISAMIFIYFKWLREFYILFPVLIFLICMANTFLSYNADSLEVERHLFVTQIMLQIIGIISLCICFDLLLNNFKERKLSKQNLV